MVGKLSERGLFKSFVTADQPGDAGLRMVAVVTGLRQASSTSRLLFGGMAGKARMNVVVDLEESESGRVIGQFGVEGKSSGGSVAAGTTPEAVDIAAQGIADCLDRHREKRP